MSQPLRQLIDVTNATIAAYTSEPYVVSFNGGKDSTVLLHLMLDMGLKPHLIWFEDPLEFPEVIEFVHEIIHKYKLTYETFRCSFEEGMRQLSSSDVKYVFMGQRKQDPKGETLQTVSKCTYEGIDIQLVNPLLEWTYENVWKYLLRGDNRGDNKGDEGDNREYCKLYKEGYTSLGNTQNTVPNPHLFFSAGTHSGEYLHASQLQHSEYERAGRR